MIEAIDRLIRMDISEILKSPKYTLLLLRAYSILYINGGQPRTCEKSMRKYYLMIKKTGMKKAVELDKKTCIVTRKGLIYTPLLHRHINLKIVTDKDAIFLLENKILKESDFEILPESMTKPKPKVKQKVKSTAKDDFKTKKG